MMGFEPDDLRRDGSGTTIFRVLVVMLSLFVKPTMRHIGPRECQPHDQAETERR